MPAKGIVLNATKAIRYFKEIRKAWKRGKTQAVPCYVPKPAFYNTVEGCHLANCGEMADVAGRLAFRSMTYEQQRTMEFSPKTGEFIERARLWQSALRSVAPNKTGHAAMVGILSWYRYIKKLEKT